MTSADKEQSTTSRRAFCRTLVMTACAFSVSTGCSLNRFLHRDDPFSASARPQFDDQATQEHLVRHLNRNTAQLQGWRSADVKIKVSDIAFPLSADLAVQAPQKFRLQVRAMGSVESDLGSNDERFWMWMKHPEGVALTARHEEIEMAQRNGLPLKPEWLMEALCVVPIDEGSITSMENRPESQLAYLTSEFMSDEGVPLKKVVEVNTRHGIVVGHSLYDSTGRLIARAGLSEHRLHRGASGEQVVLPHRIDLRWPETNMEMVMNITGDIEINPEFNNPLVWQMPNYDKVVNMAQLPDHQPLHQY